MLHANQALRSLSLEWNALGDAGVAALAPGLAANMTLTALDLRNCRLGPAGARALAETLGASGALSALSTLDLQWNKVGDEGARALAQMARQQRRIVRMELTGNRVPDAALREVMDALSRNQLSQANSGSAVDGGGVGNFNGSYNSSYNNYSRHSPARARLEKRLGDTLQTPGLSVVTTGQHSQLQHLRGAYAAEREVKSYPPSSPLECVAEQFRGGFGARSRTIAHEAAERLARAEAAEARERAAREHAEELENTAEADARRHADFVSELRTAFADAQVLRAATTTAATAAAEVSAELENEKSIMGAEIAALRVRADGLEVLQKKEKKKVFALHLLLVKTAAELENEKSIKGAEIAALRVLQMAGGTTSSTPYPYPHTLQPMQYCWSQGHVLG
ncbi:hypothetical protein T492DRAFT_1015120 [Pavlovales sp. CCMP2436]|nr:hypothetical protein T492DRAFT_1015120 [Pavlovales sp. CCMP2436]